MPVEYVTSSGCTYNINIRYLLFKAAFQLLCHTTSTTEKKVSIPSINTMLHECKHGTRTSNPSWKGITEYRGAECHRHAVWENENSIV